jgi:hypothetical protein
MKAISLSHGQFLNCFFATALGASKEKALDFYNHGAAFVSDKKGMKLEKRESLELKMN